MPFILPFTCSAQGLFFAHGAIAQSLGEATVTTTGLLAADNNAAGITALNAPAATFSFQSRFNIKSLSGVNFVFGIPKGSYKFAFVLNKFGLDHYSEQSAGLVFGHRIGAVSLGAKCLVLQIRTGENFVKQAPIVEIGGIVHLSKTISTAAHISNLNQATIKNEGKQMYYLPVVLRLGIELKSFEKVKLALEIQKEISTKVQLKTGIEYAPAKNFLIRTGVMIYQKIPSFGFGWQTKWFQLSYAVSFYQKLGCAHQITLFYSGKKRNDA